MTDLPQDSQRDVPVDATAAAEFFFAGARDAGLAHAVLSPGSRSTALAVAVTRTPHLSYSIELDERVAAFVALGYATATGKPVGLVCTSGTAAANYLPAVAEASLSNVPLVVITSDRPPEHQHWGVGQSFDQRGLYHRQVRDEITMPVGGEGGAQFSVRTGIRSVVTAMNAHGPVHVNWPFRLPIEPTSPPIAQPEPMHTVPMQSSGPELRVFDADVEYMVELLEGATSPLIIAGPHTISRSDDADSAAQLLVAAEALGIPVLADVLSGLRGGTQSSGSPPSVLVEAPALVVRAPSTPAPDLVIRLGHTPTSKAQRLWWERQNAAHVLVDPFNDWQDPSHLATARLTSPPADLLTAVAQRTSFVAAPAWLDQWRTLGKAVAQRVDETLVGWPTVTEAHIARALAETLTAADEIVASSSMPVRDLDTFAVVSAAPTVYANRGINGIDGVVSTAIGRQLARGGQGRTYALVGDVAAMHDIGGVLSAARNDVPLTVVIPNNDGGGIFSVLPIRDVLDDATFNELFHTPHGTTFSFLAGHPGMTVIQASDLRSALLETRDHPGVVVVELTVDTPERLAFADALNTAVRTGAVGTGDAGNAQGASSS